MTRKKTTLADPLLQLDSSAPSARAWPRTQEAVRENSFADLVHQVEKIVTESGNPEGFDAGQWLAAWMERSVPALGGKRPAEYMDTAEGRALISQLLAIRKAVRMREILIIRDVSRPIVHRPFSRSKPSGGLPASAFLVSDCF